MCFLVGACNYAQISLAEYTIESSKAVLMCAFGAHAFTDLARSQLASAVKHFMKGEKTTGLKKVELAVMLAPVLVRKKIVRS